MLILKLKVLYDFSIFLLQLLVQDRAASCFQNYFTAKRNMWLLDVWVLKLTHIMKLESMWIKCLMVCWQLGMKTFAHVLVNSFVCYAYTFSADHVTRQDLERNLLKYKGRILQTPPKYSALKRHGRRIADLTRYFRNAFQLHIYSQYVLW